MIPRTITFYLEILRNNDLFFAIQQGRRHYRILQFFRKQIKLEIIPLSLCNGYSPVTVIHNPYIGCGCAQIDK